MDGIEGGVPASGPSGWQGGEVFSEVQRWNRAEANSKMKIPCLDLVSRQVALDYLRENWYHSARRCFELFFHCTAYDTRERGPSATTFLITSRHRYCMAVKISIK